jgi:hypothetical protein
MVCKDHPKYTGKRNPRVLCSTCWKIRLLNIDGGPYPNGASKLDALFGTMVAFHKLYQTISQRELSRRLNI